jgi:hypothetical protein
MTAPYNPTPGYEPPTRQYPTTGSTLREPQHEEKVKPENPRHHPLAYLATLLSIIALILSILALSQDHGPTTRQVQNGEHQCVTVSQDHGPDALYCR